MTYQAELMMKARDAVTELVEEGSWCSHRTYWRRLV